jgi:REP element-mobilizing transposase RayT
MTLYKETFRIESTRLKGWDYRSPGWYFVTVCAGKKRCVFGEIEQGEMHFSALGATAHSQMETLPGHYSNVLVDSFVVMPNHVHAIIVIEGRHRYSPPAGIMAAPSKAGEGSGPPKAGSLSAIVRSYKAGVTKWAHEHGFEEFAWQERFHDHILRTNDAVNRTRDYIQDNPVNWTNDELHPAERT